MKLQTINDEFNASNLDKNQYTLSLLKECLRVKIIDERLVYNTQVQVSNILKDLIKKYTKGQSSSVTVYTAEKLIIAIWYTLDAYMLSFDKLDESIEAIKNENIEDMYIKGDKILKDDFNNTKNLYKSVIDNKLNTKLIAYNDTLTLGIKDFFKTYDIEFEPQDIPGSIDYPLAFDDCSIQGLYYIKNYLWNMYIENKICSYFKSNSVEKVMDFYGKAYKINYKDLLINIFELTLTNAVFSIMANNSSGCLYISNKQFKYLEEKLNVLNKYEVKKLIDLCIDKLIIDLNIESENEIEYIEKYKDNIISITTLAIKNNNLKNILVITEEKRSEDSKFIIDEENNLDDEAFRIVIEEIRETKSIDEKIDIIKSNINSIRDFIDMLKSDCLFKDEFIRLFISLGDLELAMLGKIVFYGEDRMDKLDLKNILLNDTITKYEYEYYYKQFLKRIDLERLKSIEYIINSL
ncbi:DUF6179 domain-containing protein [Romboutsia ilealis]|uniref:DUF6179 domain-containing protein n=1 Tax=Romboutsia ilealis TaxID=1115758 RepID=UPI0025B73BE1|nr:DUF6179 domain-containing protein [Romboutsia ilealis]